jgi:hypothetical protein
VTASGRWSYSTLFNKVELYLSVIIARWIYYRKLAVVRRRQAVARVDNGATAGILLSGCTPGGVWAENEKS